MKKPRLDQHQRFLLKLNREGKIYTPNFLVWYELAIACRRFRRAAVRFAYKNIIKILWFFMIIFLLTLVFLLSSCMPTLYERTGRAVVVDKYWSFSAGYFLTIERGGKMYDYQVTRKEYKLYNDGDTIKK